MRRRLVLFAREPEAGRVKTRLAAGVGDGRAAALYAAFLADLSRGLAGDWELVAACAEGLPAPRLAALLPGWRLVAQAGGDLGARMAAAAAHAAAEGATQVAIAGSDAPLLAAADVRGAFDALDAGAAVALAPSPDGGYALVALRAAVDAAALFAGVRWSTPDALADTRRRAAERGLRAALLPEVPDVDVADDVPPLRRRLALRPEAAPETARVLREWGTT